MKTHTPGPWEYVTKITASESHRGFFIRAEKQTKDGKWTLADVQPGDEDGNVGKANARLISAAPCLLAALIRLINADGEIGSASNDVLEDIVESHTIPFVREQAAAFLQCRDAIAKATGAA